MRIVLKKIISMSLVIVILLSVIVHSPAGAVAANNIPYEYEPILKAYKQAYDSIYSDFDKNLLGNTYFGTILDMYKSAVQSIQFVGYSLADLDLYYSAYDISGDGNPELIIGARTRAYPDTEIFVVGMYSIYGNEAKSIYQLSLAPYEYIAILPDHRVNVVSGRMGYYPDDIYEFDSKGDFVLVSSIEIIGEPKPIPKTVVLNWKPLAEYVNDLKNTFIDVKTGDWFFGSVQYVCENALFEGTSKTTFEPQGKMTRAMMVTVLHRLVDMPAPGAARFTDVPHNTWYSDAVNWAANNNIVKGVGSSVFDPNANITREQMALMLYNFAEVMGAKFPTTRPNENFADANKISTWAKGAVDTMLEAEIISGKGNGIFDPQGTATRAEVATVFMNFINITAE